LLTPEKLFGSINYIQYLHTSVILVHIDFITRKLNGISTS